jgi:hypothetical protein
VSNTARGPDVPGGRLAPAAMGWDAGAVDVLAHQGGWDEILLVVTPIALFAGLLWAAKRRAEAEDVDEATEHAEATGVDEPSPAHEG